MWSLRNVFSLTALPDCGAAAAAITPPDFPRSIPQGSPMQENNNNNNNNSSKERGEDNKKSEEVHFIASLTYALIPAVTREEAAVVLSWALDGKCVDGRAAAAALTQVEYFFAGTDNGQLCMFPLFPCDLRPFLTNTIITEPDASLPQESSSSSTSKNIKTPAFNGKTGRRRLLHLHGCEEPVVSAAVLGNVIASVATDAYMHLSFFHPTPRHVVSIAHPSPLRCVLLWDGSIFVNREDDAQRRSEISEAEASVVYVITGDESGVARIWRVNVDYSTYFLIAVFAISTPTGCVGFASPLHYLSREDRDARPAVTRQTKIIHCLAIDDDQRLLAGVEGGVVVWSLAALPWKQQEEDHLFCYDDNGKNDEQGPQEQTVVTARLRFRAERLMDMSVWVKGRKLLREALHSEDSNGIAECDEDEDNNNNRDGNNDNGSRLPSTVIRRSKWKPKYDTHVANGFDVGVVSNMVIVPSHLVNGASAAQFLHEASVPIIFPSLKNTVHFPLSVVEPVFTPLQILSTTGSSCFAILILQNGKRIVTSGSDSRVVLWQWDAAAGNYIMTLASEEMEGHRVLGRHLCLLRSPDIFISCGYDGAEVHEWHVYDEPELMMRCERRFSVRYINPDTRDISTSHTSSTIKLEDNNNNNIKEKDTVSGIACAITFPTFYAFFVVGLFECTIQTFGLSEVQGCTPPEDYVYNGFKTVRVVLPAKSDS
ncbi:uncharacterized protein TM35_000401550 [Trypanosoma theileri]|uniref:Guanine nucleotide-binding protein subunit beta-like protein n=1 Tax=Trypanosoma theileri TaxID=67003 RepID=A0A1X0NK49_9TRYP|nr:uncharacterized protein TM35_000401550 [Trypanosoma theileri]ORC84888.1 hypothetical protein TM35_000401550 [Trypanosoma theileri]